MPALAPRLVSVRTDRSRLALGCGAPRSHKLRVPVDINAVARDAIRLAELDGEPRISLRTSFFQPLPRVAGSPDELVQAICNLLVHARESLDGVEGAVIEIETEPDAELVAIRILDNGPGMPDDLLEQIFDPFRFEAEERDDARDGKQPNDPFGLSEACEILREHKGTLTVRSRPGEGTCFVALLPVQRG